MSINPKLPPSKRRQIIKDNAAFHIVGNKDQEGSIAWMCGVDEKTIRRDKQKMKDSGEWEEYIESTILNLSVLGDIDDTTKFREYMKIYSKQFSDKHTIETSGDMTFTLNTWRDEKRRKLQSTMNPTPDSSPSMKTDTKLNIVDSSVELDQEKRLLDAKSY